MFYYDGKYGWENVVKNYIGPSTVFAFYLGGSFKTGKVFNSPLRKDNNPSFSIFEGKEELMYKDFATGDSGNCIKLVQELFNLSKSNAIIQILVDLYRSNISPSNTEVIPSYHSHISNASIGLKTIDFENIDLTYWNKYHITKETLDKFEVVNCSHVWINNNLTWYRTDKEPIYAYLMDNKIKVYRPKSKKAGKWAGNSAQINVFGLKQLSYRGDTLIITKSGKDVMVLSELGFNAVAPNSETTLIPEEIITDLKSRFNNVYTLMDNDPAGRKAGVKYNEVYNIKDIYLPGKEKDISDYIEIHTSEDTRELILSLL